MKQVKQPEHQVYPRTAEDWLKTPLGASLLEQETRLVQEVIDDVFGEECLQIGTWGEPSQFLKLSRTQRSHLIAGAGDDTAVIAEAHRLPVESDSVDSILLPHTLDYSKYPHAVLREVHRVLRASGHLVIMGFRPGGLWGLRRLIPGAEFPPGAHDMLSDRVLRDWMKLLDMRVHGVTRYFFRWPLQTRKLRSSQWERRGRRFWPEMSACYLITAQKRVSTLTPVRPTWRETVKVVGGLAEPANRTSPKIRFEP